MAEPTSFSVETRANVSPPKACSTEQRLLMAMLAYPRGDRIWGEPVELAGETDWPMFLAATDEKVQPYLHWVSEQPPFASVVPTFVRNELAKTRFSTRIRNLRWATELRSITHAFRQRCIPILMLKGAALQRTVYPDISTRPMADMDLFVRRADLSRINELMLGLGFLLRTTPDRHTPLPGYESGEDSIFIKYHGTSILMVEIHTRLEMHGPGLSDSPESIWDYQVEVMARDGILVPTLEPLTALRHLCLHLAKHDYDFGLIWLLDIRLFLDRYGSAIDWNDFSRRCDRQTRQAIGFTLFLAAKWLGAVIPADQWASLPPDKEELASGLAWEQMTNQLRTRKAPNAVILALSLDPRRAWRYLTTHVASWISPVSGSSTKPVMLMFSRIRSDFRIFRAAYRANAFDWSNIQKAKQSDRRAKRLREVLESE